MKKKSIAFLLIIGCFFLNLFASEVAVSKTNLIINQEDLKISQQSNLPDRIDVKVHLNSVHGLYKFMQALCEDRHTPKILRDVYLASKFNTTGNAEEIKKFSKLLDEIGSIQVTSNSEGENSDAEEENRLSADDLVVTQSGLAIDLNDFSGRLTNFFHISFHSEFFRLLRHFEPIYKSLIWDENFGEMVKYKELIEKNLIDWDFSNRLKKILIFYNGNWPNDYPINISLFTLPKDTKASNASSHNAFESFSVIIGEKDFVGRIGVLVHEISHTFFETETKQFKKELKRFFDESKNPSKGVAYQYLNEALATAIGNGAFFRDVTGNLDTTSWYNNKIIDGAAKAILPLYDEYIKAGQTMDQAFVERYIELFDKEFPNAANNLSIILNNARLISDGNTISLGELSKIMEKALKISITGWSAPLNHKYTYGYFEENFTKIVVIDMKELKQLYDAKKVYPNIFNEKQISKFLNKIKKEKVSGIIRLDVSEKVSKTKNNNQTIFLLIKNENTTYEKIFEELAKKNELIKAESLFFK